MKKLARSINVQIVLFKLQESLIFYGLCFGKVVMKSFVLLIT